MNWKLFITACVSTALVSFPQNIIGCGPDADPYDYYTSFFQQNLSDAKGYKPFYYTGYNFLYDETEPLSTADALAKEWADYCGSAVTETDAKDFVNKFAWKDCSNLYFNIEKNQPLKIPDSVTRNGMTSYFIKEKDLEGLGYIMYAKQVEPYVYAGESSWDLPERDSIKMAKLIKNGQQLYSVAKKDVFKLKYAYQVLRLAHYSGRYTDVIKWYDDYSVHITGNSVLQPMCVALKAGALFRTGKSNEAAYLFSKAFSTAQVKRISNYLGFKWSVKYDAPRTDYLQLCKNNSEKAAMLALFAIGSTASETGAMKEIYALDPANEVLEVLAVREINKLEEKYFTPLLQKEKGGKALYYSWANNDSVSTIVERNVKELADFLHTVTLNATIKNAGFFETAAAYTAFMTKDYATAKKYLAGAEKMKLTQKVKDQWALTNLLVTINQKEKIDGAFEEALLPSIQWLEQKVKSETPEKTGYYGLAQWKIFYRNLMSEIVAQRYHQQGDLYKETLAIGNADYITLSPDSYTYSSGISFLRNSLGSKDVEQLFALLNNKQANKFETYLINHNAVKKADVTDFAGTAYLREYDYGNAITWFKKSTDKTNSVINTNPFIDLLYDQEEALPAEAKFSTTKLAFAEEMLRLQKLTVTDKVNAAKHMYKMALGFYNMTYYGHAWHLVQYDRSGSDGYYIPADATAFDKEYYGCFKALEYFEKAMAAGTDKNFKARCLFMMAKCAQKQIHQPKYSDYVNNYDAMDTAEKKYFMAFKHSKYFPQLVKEYSTTAFYKQAYNSCSYLRDFIATKK